jgi:serralysin
VLGSPFSDQLTSNPADGNLLVGNNGNDTLISTGPADTMTGGAGGDVFAFANPNATGSVITDFQSNTDNIDLRPVLTAMGWHGTDPLSDGTVSFVAVSGGTAIMLSADHNPADAHLLATVDGISTLHPWDFYLPSGSTSTGGSPPAAPPPPPPPVVSGVIDDSHASGPVTVDLTATPSVTQVIGSVYSDLLTGSPQGGDLLIGGGGNDTLVSQGSHDTLSITAGGDTFGFANPAATGDVITHFQSNTDSIDMRPALAAMGWHGSNPLTDGTISFAAAAGGTAIMLSSDGNPADAHLLATVDGVSTLHSWDFYLPSPGAPTSPPVSPPASPPPPASFDVIHGTGWVDGTAGNDSLIGDSGSDSLVGNGGNDTFVGGLFMQGFGGDDVFNVTNGATHIVEPTANHAQVMSAVSYSLFDEDYNVSHLTLTGSGNLTGTGSWGNDVLTANAGNSTLNGLGGADTLVGGAGHDTFVFQSMSDQNSVIQNFVHGQDVIDLHGVLTQVGSSGDAIANGTVVLAQHAADTVVEINDHTGALKPLVTLAGIHAANLTAGDFHY